MEFGWWVVPVFLDAQVVHLVVILVEGFQKLEDILVWVPERSFHVL